MGTVKENLIRIRAEIAALTDRPVRIMAVSKRQPLEKLQEAVAAGADLFGVNYAQEGEAQMTALGRAGITWHFIGHIQSRKAKGLIHYDMVQSLDRLEVGEILQRRCEAEKRTLPVLIELNLGDETQKSGIAPSQLEDFLAAVARFPALRPSGLMALPPPLPAEARRPFFRQARALYDRFAAQYPFDTLSLGTSEDYRVAVEEGANLVRLGTVLLGSRPL